MTTTAQLRIEQLAQYPDFLPIVASWIYKEWWTGIAEETVESLTGKLVAHLTHDRIPLTLVALLERCPVGTVTLLDHDVGTEQWPERSPWLAALYVVPEYRRRGIGAGLVNAAAANAMALGVETLYLATVEREAFYARLGWEITDRVTAQVVMSKRVGRNVR
jgi:predicted N-acetyltransferase YhbS